MWNSCSDRDQGWRDGRPDGTPSLSFTSSRQVPMLFGDKSQREDCGGSRARGGSLDTTKGKGEVLIPVYDPNRGRLKPRELYAILHVVFAETDITVHLHKKYYLSLA